MKEDDYQYKKKEDNIYKEENSEGCGSEFLEWSSTIMIFVLMFCMSMIGDEKRGNCRAIKRMTD